MSHPTGEEWRRTHYKGVARANRARRGQPKTFSPKRSATMKKWWRNKEYKKKQIASHSSAAKKMWEERSTEVLKAMKEKQSRSMSDWWRRNENYKRMLQVRREQAKNEKSIENISIGLKRKWADPKFRRKMRKIRKVQANDPKNRLLNSVAMEAKWEDPEYRAKQKKNRKYDKKWKKNVSKGVKKALAQGKMRWNLGRTMYDHPTLMAQSIRQRGIVPNWRKYGCWYKGINGKIWMRSSWEPAFAKWMDDNEIEWQYEKKRFYVGEGEWNGVTYIPDFYLSDQGQYIELKGWLDPKQKKKISKFRRMYPEIKFWILRRKHLKNILKKYKKKRK